MVHLRLRRPALESYQCFNLQYFHDVVNDSRGAIELMGVFVDFRRAACSVMAGFQDSKGDGAAKLGTASS